jgi:hypothetical protein
MSRTLFLLFFIFSLSAFSQTRVSGTAIEKGGKGLPGANIIFLDTDSSFVKGTVTDTSGIFSVELETGKNYILKSEYIGYETKFKNIITVGTEMDAGKVFMRSVAQNLSEVEIKTLQKRGEQRGDTVSFNADAFKTNPDATAEDLIKKMPGVSSDNNGVKVNGEEVKKVLVDGKAFYGDDASAAVKNLPAEIIDKVEFFDKMSDQASFSGFNDGDASRALNFITKKGKNVGQFGRVYAGAGADTKGDPKYNGGATLNSFNSQRRVSLLLMTNNINQQNFSMSDITGAMGNSGSSNRGGGSSGGNFGGGGNRGPGGPGGGNSGLMTNQLNGISAANSAGLNYSDEWGKKVIVSGSYFANYSENKNYALLRRTYFSNDKLIYDQLNDDNTKNLNHRFNFRLEWNIDSNNKIIFTPALTYQDNLVNSYLNGTNTVLDSILLSSTSTTQKTGNIGYDLSGNLLYQHKFKKLGRTISLNVYSQQTEKNNEGSYYSTNIYTDTTTGLNQLYKLYANTKKASLNLSYTEPINKYAQVQLSYNPSYNNSIQNKNTNDYDPLMEQYVDFDTALSNKYLNIYQTQKAGLSYKYNKNKLRFSFGADAQQASLNGDQTFPTAFKLDQTFNSILPNAEMNYKFTRTNNLRLNYRTSTNIPNMTQLQNVLDISNPLQVKSGNTTLKQTYEHNLSFRVGGFNPKTAKNLMMFVNVGMTDNYITNNTFTLRRDTTIQGYEIKGGSQLTKPVNLNGYYSGRGFATYGFPLKSIRSNMNVNGGINFSHTPGLNNDILNYADNYAYNGGVVIGSNISKNVDFSLAYTGNYTKVINSVQKQSNNAYFYHTATARLNLILFKGLVINSDVTHTFYNGLSQNFNQEFLLWNAYIGYKFLKSRTLEAKVTVFDILKQNKSITRTVNSNYTEDNNSRVLQQYWMVTVTYTLRNFKKGGPPKSDEPENPYRDMNRKNGVGGPGGGG